MESRIRKTLVGVYIFGGVILFIIFYILLSGKITLHPTKEIKVYFDDATGLRPGDPVLIHGIEKGRVKTLHLEGDRVLVILAIHPDIRLSDDSKISIKLVNYLGADRYVKIVPGKSGVIPEYYYGYNVSFDLELVGARLDSLINFFEGIKLPDLEMIGDRLTTSFDKNLKELVVSIKEPSDRLALLILKIGILVDSLNQIFQKKGTVSKFVESDELYEEIRETNRAIRVLIEDIKANPKKYLHIKIF